MSDRGRVPARDAGGLPVRPIGNRDKNGDCVSNAIGSDYSAHRSHPAAIDGSVVRAAKSANFVNGGWESRVVARWQRARDRFADSVDDNGIVDENRARRRIEESERASEDIVLERRVTRVSERASQWELAMQGSWWSGLDDHLPN